jgi:hypothetical protein
MQLIRFDYETGSKTQTRLRHLNTIGKIDLDETENEGENAKVEEQKTPGRNLASSHCVDGFCRVHSCDSKASYHLNN